MKKCETHHYACDCREEKLQAICIEVLGRHEWDTGGKGRCQCWMCKSIRELYGFV